MKDFNFQGIRAGASVVYPKTEYKDSDGRKRSRFERCVRTHFYFWDFCIDDDLSQLAFVKSIFTYFIHNSEKKSTKSGGRLILSKELEQETHEGQTQMLCFTAKQKNDKNFLHISMTEDDEFMEEIYLDVIDVLMLDAAITKTINLISPYEFDFVGNQWG